VSWSNKESFLLLPGQPTHETHLSSTMPQEQLPSGS